MGEYAQHPTNGNRIKLGACMEALHTMERKSIRWKRDGSRRHVWITLSDGLAYTLGYDSRDRGLATVHGTTWFGKWSAGVNVTIDRSRLAEMIRCKRRSGYRCVRCG